MLPQYGNDTLMPIIPFIALLLGALIPPAHKSVLPGRVALGLCSNRDVTAAGSLRIRKTINRISSYNLGTYRRIGIVWALVSKGGGLIELRFDSSRLIRKRY